MLPTCFPHSPFWWKQNYGLIGLALWWTISFVYFMLLVIFFCYVCVHMNRACIHAIQRPELQLWWRVKQPCFYYPDSENNDQKECKFEWGTARHMQAFSILIWLLFGESWKLTWVLAPKINAGTNLLKQNWTDQLKGRKTRQDDSLGYPKVISHTWAIFLFFIF